MKKAQIEMMGLVVIVIIITIGIFFSVALRQTPSTKQPLDVYSDEKFSGDFLIAFLETYDSNCGVEMKELAKDCMRIHAHGTGNYNCGEDSCQYLNESIKYVLDETLGKWNYEYELTFTHNNQVLSSFTQGCGLFVERGAPGLQPLPPPRGVAGTGVFQLDICG